MNQTARDGGGATGFGPSMKSRRVATSRPAAIEWRARTCAILGCPPPSLDSSAGRDSTMLGQRLSRRRRPGRLVHDLRRTAVRNLERASVPRSAAMKLTGHRTEAVYAADAIVDSARLEEAAVKLAALH